MLLPILFLFLNGIAAQEPQTETTNEKLDKLLSYVQEKLHISEFASNIANSESGKIQRIITSIEAGCRIILDNLENKMCPFCEACEVMKGRQAAATAISVCQLLLVIAYLATIGGIYIVKCFKKKKKSKTTGGQKGTFTISDESTKKVKLKVTFLLQPGFPPN